jgi:hypothetical protein
VTEENSFRHFGEWAHAVCRAAHGPADLRLMRAPTGAGETDPTIGGFLVPESYAQEILTTLYEDRTSLLNYLQKFNVPDGRNSILIPAVDETSRANGYRWGNITLGFANEGVQPTTASFPKFKQTEIAAEKMIGLVVVTSELMRDAGNLGTFLQRALKDEMLYVLEQYILSSAGTGAGVPLGINNAGNPALVTAAKVTGQTSGTLNAQNLRTMWSLLPAGSRRRAVWAVGESAMTLADAFPSEISFAASGACDPDDLPRIMGRPVIETDVLPAVGTPGDVLLFDPAWYGFASKEPASALSAHAYFANDQLVLRLTWRCGGAPLITSKITGSDGTSRSPYINLAQR